MPQGSPTSGVGRVIAGRYILLNRLGSGGMGHVWLAHDQRLACEVALKEIVFSNPAYADAEREARVARARAEARNAAGLRGHPHVVTVHDVLEHEGLPWIVMEYVADAVDLRDLVGRPGSPAPAECARIGLAVLDALTAGHQRGVMHRDVKPANILLAPDRTGSTVRPRPAHRLRHLGAAGRRGDAVHADVRARRYGGLSGAGAGHGRAADRRRPTCSRWAARSTTPSRATAPSSARPRSPRSPRWSWRTHCPRSGRARWPRCSTRCWRRIRYDGFRRRRPRRHWRGS